jgi:hypothetical protein
MCNLQKLDPTTAMETQQEPIAPGQGPVTDALAAGGVTRATGPATGAVKDTKFGKLLKVAMPIVQGGLIGGFGGNWRVPGSGNAAAQNFFTTRTQLALEKQRIANQTAQEKFLNALRASEMERNAFYEKYLTAGTEQREHQANAPYKTPPDPSQTYKPLPGYPGVEVNGLGQTRKVTAPTDATHPTPIPIGEPPSQAARETQSKKPQLRAETSRNAAGTAVTRYRDVNPNSPTYMQLQDENQPATRAPLPRRAGSTKADQGKIEQYAEAIAAGVKAGKNAEEGLALIPPQYRAAVRQRVREMGRPLKPKVQIDLGKVDLSHIKPTE